MKQKLVLAFSFIVIAVILPLLKNIELLFSFKMYIVVICIFLMWMTQPAVSKKETVENRGKDKFSVLIILLMSVISVIIPVVDWAYYGIPENKAMTALGALLMFVGIFFRAWAVQVLGNHFTATVQTQADHQLITKGPYQVVRHPSYLGAMLAIVGASVFLNSFTGTICSVICMLVAYYIRIKVEEKALVSMFGTQYYLYQKKVKGLIPFIW